MKNSRTMLQKVKRFLEPVKGMKKVTLLSFIHFFFYGLTGIIFVVFLEQVFFVLEKGSFDDFRNIIFLFGIVFFFQQGLYYLLRSAGWTGLNQDLRKILYQKYLPQYLRLDNNTIESVGTGKMIAIISKGTKTWGQLLARLLEYGTYTLIGFIFTIFMISKISIFLTLLFCTLVFIGAYVGNILNKKMMKAREQRYVHDNIVTKDLVKIIMSKNEILQSDKIVGELQKLEKEESGKTKANVLMAKPLVLFFQIPEFIVFIILMGFFIVFGNLYFQGEISLSVLSGVSGALLLMQQTLGMTMSLIKDIAKEFVDIEKMWDFFDTTPELQGYDTGKEFIHKNGEIKMQNLTFGYDNSQPVFEGFSLQIPGEKITAFVGNSGSGKSTLVKLIAGYLQTDKGEIIIDGQKINEISLKSYYKDIGYLTQEPSVFDGSIYENLVYALQEEVQQEQLDEIIKLSKCEFIYDFKDGIQTEIGEKGIRLSGGQRQRLAIAKIMLKNPKIIILDEPTSALDSFSEEQITIAMNNLFKGRTVIVIAHRLQTVKHADQIHVFENGKIVESGTHETLTKKEGIYKKMLDLQSGF